MACDERSEFRIHLLSTELRTAPAKSGRKPQEGGDIDLSRKRFLDDKTVPQEIVFFARKFFCDSQQMRCAIHLFEGPRFSVNPLL